MMSDNMPPHVHSITHRTHDVLLPPSLPHVSPTAGVTKLSSELFLTTDVYVTYIQHT